MSVLKIHNTEIPYSIRHSRRARHGRIMIRAGHVEIIVPRRVSVDKMLSFAEEKSDWIYRTHLRVLKKHGKTPKPMPEIFGARPKVMFRGELVPVRVHTKPVRSITVDYDGETFFVAVPPKFKGRVRDQKIRTALYDYFKDILRKDADIITRKHADAIGKSPKQFRIKHQKTRWGSCSTTGIINLNVVLAHAPKTVSNYVIVHELCHLVHPNHSRRYWNLVERIMPRYKSREEWLKNEGSALLSY